MMHNPRIPCPNTWFDCRFWYVLWQRPALVYRAGLLFTLILLRLNLYYSSCINRTLCQNMTNYTAVCLTFKLKYCSITAWHILKKELKGHTYIFWASRSRLHRPALFRIWFNNQRARRKYRIPAIPGGHLSCLTKRLLWPFVPVSVQMITHGLNRFFLHRQKSTYRKVDYQWKIYAIQQKPAFSALPQ